MAINIPQTELNSASPQYGLNTGQGAPLSPLVGLGQARLQSTQSQQQIQQATASTQEERNKLAQQFIDTVRGGQTDLSQFNYIPTFESLAPQQQSELQNIKNNLGLGELVKSNNPSPADLMSALQAKQKMETNKAYIPPFLQKLGDIDVDYDPMLYYSAPPPKKDYTQGTDPLGGLDTEGYKFNPNYNLGKSPDGAARATSEYDAASIQGIIDRYGRGKSPLTAQDYIRASQETGVPVDALLTQGALESNFAIAGAAVTTKNVGNVGNTDDGSLEYQKSYYDGLLRQANLLKNEYNYEGGFTADRFIANNFTRPQGGRYASDPEYGSKYSNILRDVRSKLYKPPVPTNSNLPRTKQESGNRDFRVVDSVEWGGQWIADTTPLGILKPPTLTGKVNSPFGYRPVAGQRFNVSKNNGQQINFGADFFGKIGDPAVATADGVVVAAGTAPAKGAYNSGAGNYVTLEFDIGGEKYYADYNHLSQIGVKKGDKLKAGGVLGKIGDTGNTVGAHLDFQVYRRNNGTYQYIDTSPIFNNR